MAGTKLSNGNRYFGEYTFQQAAPPESNLTVSSAGAFTVSVKFGGASPLTDSFLKKVRALRLPEIKDNGSLGGFNNTTSLVKLFDGYSIETGTDWTFITLNFRVPATDSPTAKNDDTRDREDNIQSVRVDGPGKSYYEAEYYAPTRVNRWTSNSEAGPRTSGPSEEIRIIRDKLHTDPDAETADLTPIEATEYSHRSNEVIPGILWENETTVMKILKNEDRSGE